jgi:hypothetical protein
MKEAFHKALVGSACTSPDGTMIHAETVKVVELANYLAQSQSAALLVALKEARQVLVTACGTEAPYIKIALERTDTAIAAAS